MILHSIKEQGQNYVTHDLDLNVIIHVLKMWRQYLIRRIFLLISNNISLKYVFIKKILMLDKIGGYLF